MTIQVSPSQSQIFAALRAFLLDVLPQNQNIEVVRGIVNRVPQVVGPDFVVMWALRLPRLATNIDEYLDATLEGSISNGILSVSSVGTGSIVENATLFGENLVGVVSVGRQISGEQGQIGTYLVNTTQTLSAQAFACGTAAVEQFTEVVIQADVHGPNSQDNTQAITTLFKDEYAVQFFSNLSDTGSTVSPLYVEEPRMVPYKNENDQIEQRWVVVVHLEADITVTIPQEFFDAITINPVPLL